jgi:hypothetical protein
MLNFAIYVQRQTLMDSTIASAERRSKEQLHDKRRSRTTQSNTNTTEMQHGFLAGQQTPTKTNKIQQKNNMLDFCWISLDFEITCWISLDFVGF